jgi:hypothetical protein
MGFARRVDRKGPGVGCAVALVLLYGAACYRTAPPPRMASLRIKAEPANTSVYVDDRFVGTARVLAVKPKAMKPGVRFITFEAPGYFPHDLRLDLAPGTTEIEIKLRPVPP